MSGGLRLEFIELDVTVEKAREREKKKIENKKEDELQGKKNEQKKQKHAHMFQGSRHFLGSNICCAWHAPYMQ